MRPHSRLFLGWRSATAAPYLFWEGVFHMTASRPLADHSLSTVWFNASVFMLLALEIVGCTLGVLSLGSRTRKHSTPEPNSNLPRQGHTNLSSSQFNALMQAKS